MEMENIPVSEMAALRSADESSSLLAQSFFIIAIFDPRTSRVERTTPVRGSENTITFRADLEISRGWGLRTYTIAYMWAEITMIEASLGELFCLYQMGLKTAVNLSREAALNTQLPVKYNYF